MSLEKFFSSKNHSETSHLLRSIFEDAIDGIIAIDEKGIVEAVNPAAAHLFGYEVEEIVEQNIKMLMPEPDHSNHDTYIENYHRTGIKKIIGIGRQVDGLRKDGQVFPFRLSVSEVQTKERRFYTGFIHDVSDLRAAQEQLSQLNQQLEKLVNERTEELSDVVNRLLQTNNQLKHEVSERQAVEEALRQSEQEIRAAYEKEKELGQLKSRFVSMASHEFRTPLTTINSSAALLARYILTEQQDKREKHLKRIRTSVDHLTGILNDFLSLSKLEEGKMELQLTQFDWNEFCLETLDELKGVLKEGQEITYQNNKANLLVTLDERILKNILFNLLSNAMKYSPENTTIFFKSSLEDDCLKLEIKDNGIGIPLADQKYLFTRFFRANNASNIKGTGLGLTIVKRYLTLLGGTIDFESQEGEGTSFFVDLPIKLENTHV